MKTNKKEEKKKTAIAWEKIFVNDRLTRG